MSFYTTEEQLYELFGKVELLNLYLRTVCTVTPCKYLRGNLGLQFSARWHFNLVLKGLKLSQTLAMVGTGTIFCCQRFGSGTDLYTGRGTET
jgi:hypothetical protein